ncbi:hypothetical protein ACLBXM_16635 [Xanthobacteraceae bacterium A53D]
MAPPPEPTPPPSTLPRRALWFGLAVATLLIWLPFLGVVGAIVTAEVLGCRLNEGNAHPCLLFGRDIGDTLYSLFVMGWLMLLTAPLMVITALLWSGLALRRLWRRLRR